MKKALAAVIVIVLGLSILGCSGSPSVSLHVPESALSATPSDSDTGGTEDRASAEPSAAAGVEATTVGVTLSAAVMKFADPDYDPATYAGDPEHDSVVLSDGSVVLTLSKPEHDQMVKDIHSAFDKGASLFLDGEDTAAIFESIVATNDRTSVTIKTSSSELGIYHGVAAWGLGLHCALYQAYTGVREPSVVVTFINSATGAVISEMVLPE